MRSLKLLAVALVVTVAHGTRAADAPHVDGVNCSNCHLGHSAPGAALTKFGGNFSLCQDCHTKSAYTTHFGFPWGEADQAVPGVAGRSHSWSATSTNLGASTPSIGSADPAEVEMAKRLDGGNIMCSTCHDQHQADVLPLGGRGSQHTSGVTKVVTAGGSGTVAVTSVPSNLQAKSYVIQITLGGNVGTAVFRVSNDRKRTWIQTGVVTAASVTLGDGAVLELGGSNFVATEEYNFYVSYPFLRADNTDAKMCTICHKDRHVSTANVEGGGGTLVGTGEAIVLGTTVFHHPVNEAFDTPATPLDANGATQTVGDGIRSNDLVLGTGGIVTCTTCHRVHNADSNSLTADP